jgi:hypothetical protein
MQLGRRLPRFSKAEVMTNMDGVLEPIAGIAAFPLPDPPRQAGEGSVSPRS